MCGIRPRICAVLCRAASTRTRLSPICSGSMARTAGMSVALSVAAEQIMHLLHKLRRVEIAHHHHGGVVGRIVGLVVVVEIVAGHRAQVALPADHAVPVGVDLEGRRRHSSSSRRSGSFSDPSRSDMITVRSEATSSGSNSELHHAVRLDLQRAGPGGPRAGSRNRWSSRPT